MKEMLLVSFGFCVWDIPALILLVAMAVALAAHILRQRQREKEFEKREKTAETA